MVRSEKILNDLAVDESFRTPAESIVDPGILNSIFDDLPLIMTLINQDLKIENINRTATVALEKEKNDSFGLLSGELFGCVNSFKREGCGKNRECSECLVRKSVMHTFETGENIYKKEVELKIKTNGRFVTLHLLISTILIQQNDDPMVLLTADDITEQKLAEKETLEASAKNEAFLNVLPDLIFECKRDGTIVDYRASTENDLYVPPNEFLGKKIIEILPKELTRKTMYSIEQAIQTKELQSFQYQLPVNGKMLDFEARLVSCGEDSALAIVSNITERKQIEREMRIKDNAMASSINAIALADLEGNLTYVNSAFLNLWGYDHEKEVLGKPAITFWEMKAEAKEIVKALVTEGSWKGELIAKKKDNTKLTTYLSASMVTDKAGQPICMMASFMDISKHKQAEEAMFNAKLAAEDANRTKTEFIANMSHELRTPLTSIIGFSDILFSENFGSLNKYQKKYASNVLRNGKHLLNIINDIISISNIETRKMELHIDEFFVSDTIDEVEALMIPIASKKDIDLTCNIDIETPIIKADTIKFKQILYNLVSNAIKFTDQGGSVTIGGKISEHIVHISVKDNGIGISPEGQDKLFNPFFQADSSSTREYGGTGLGLALVKKFVEMHDGQIWVDSEVGKGSTFTFRIPTAFENTSF